MGIMGVIGGLGPESTLEYYRSLISLYREHKKDGNNPHILINSINMKRLLDLIVADRLEEAASYLGEEIERVAKAGASFCIVTAGTPHIVFESLRANSTIPLISIVEETCKHTKRLGLRRVGLFATKFTMQGKFYRKVFDGEAITIITPNPDDQNYIHEKYMTELVSGIVLDETKQRLLSIAQALKTEQNIEGLILGGTELSLILSDGDDADIPFLDTTRIHAQSAVEELLRLEQGKP
jgi:aspartate racemase